MQQQNLFKKQTNKKTSLVARAFLSLTTQLVRYRINETGETRGSQKNEPVLSFVQEDSLIAIAADLCCHLCLRHLSGFH